MTDQQKEALEILPDAEGEKNKLSSADIDRIICKWSTELLVVLTEEQLNDLVDRLCKLLGLLS